jgi:hypothetical protein
MTQNPFDLQAQLGERQMVLRQFKVGVVAESADTTRRHDNAAVTLAHTFGHNLTLWIREASMTGIPSVSPLFRDAG